MGDYFETLVDVDVAEDDAGPGADRVLAWLVAQGIVEPDRTDCVLGGEGGHPPGSAWSTAVAAPDRPWQWGSVNGLDVAVGREFHSGIQAMELEAAGCPRCGGPGADHADATAEQIMAAVSAWYDGGTGDVACQACSFPIGLNDWVWGESSPIAAGALALTFWNWPQLSQTFVDSVAQLLGHRVVRVWGKL